MDELDLVEGWLKTSGFPLESEVAGAFRTAGFEVVQGLHYRADRREAEGAREIDMLAVRDQFVGRHPTTRCTVLYVLECKASTVPWVIFRSRAEADVWGALGRYPMTGITDVNMLAGLDADDGPWLLKVPADFGYRLAAAKGRPITNGGRRGGRQPSQTPVDAADVAATAERSERRDPAYMAIRQAVAAASGVLRDDPTHLPTLAVPVIVVGAPLYNVSYGDDGQARIEPTHWERMLWRGTFSAQPVAIDVVSAPFATEYAAMAAVGADEILPLMRLGALDARYESMRREDPRGLLERAILAIEWIADSAHAVSATAQRHLRRRTR